MKCKTIFKIIITISAITLLYTNINAYKNKATNIDATSTIKEIITETNFKLDFKNVNELEYIMQDDIINYNNGLNKTFSKNNKFNILTLDTGKISSISYTSPILEMNNLDMDYLQKVYNFVFDNISSYLFDKTNELIQKMQNSDYIELNKNSIESNGYYKEVVDLNKTSQIQITTYYQNNNEELIPYKISLDILQGNKW